MSVSLSQRYARAAVAAAQESNEVSACIADLIAFRAKFREIHELQQLLTNPALANERLKVLDAVLMQASVCQSAANLLRTLAARGRIELLDGVVEAAERLADELQHRLHAEVWSPMTLDDGERQALAGALEKRLGRKVVLDVNEAPELLAGLVVQVGDLKFDSSIRRQLEILRERLESAVH